MSVDHNRWRDQQLNGFKNLSNSCAILEQESVMLNFVKTWPDVTWSWMAPETNFKKICHQHIDINNVNYNGVIVFGPVLNQPTTRSLVSTIQRLISNCTHAYVAINRYEVVEHDLNIELPDDIDSSLDIIMKYCDPNFQRLHTFDHVDGNHMVQAHPMDCYGLCK